MFDDSDFEFNDEEIDAVFENVSSVVSNNLVQKRPYEEENPFEKQGKITQINQLSRPVKKQREYNTTNKSQDVANDVYKQFCSIEKKSVEFNYVDTSKRLSPIIFYNEPSSSSNLHKNITKKVVQRKFPGPAGLLPEKMDKTNLTKTIDDEYHFRNMQSTEEPMLVSQCCELSFDDKLWNRMLEDLECEKLDNKYILPEKYNIEWIKNKALNHQLVNQKAPFLVAVISSIECSNIKSPVLIVTLKDKTGEIQGTIDYDLYKEYIVELVVGSIIIVKQFSVLSTGTSYMLNITVKNLIRIYYENNSEKKLTFHDEFGDNILLETSAIPEQIKIINVQDFSVKDIIKSINEISNYKKQTEISDEALGVFLDNFNKNFDNKKSSSGCNQSKFSSQSTKTFPHSSIQPSSCISPQISNTISKTLSNSNIKSNAGNTPPKKSKFNFKAARFNKENQISKLDEQKSLGVSSQSCSQISIKADNVEEKKMVENIFEGLDADSFFEDF